jgi:hypothetical protein
VSGGRTGNWGYKAALASGAGGGVLKIFELPNFPDTTGATGSAAVPYGFTIDGNFAVGMSYRGAERAVLWDTSDLNPARWTAVDLTLLATSRGILSPFTRLGRAYSIGRTATGEFVIAGTGLVGGSTRGFVMAIAPPLAPLAHPPTVTLAGSPVTGFTFSFPSLDNSGVTYHLERATQLNAPAVWTTIDSAPGSGNQLSLSDPSPPATQCYYRVRVQ